MDDSLVEPDVAGVEVCRVSEPSTVWGEEPGGAEVGSETMHLYGHSYHCTGEGEDVTESNLLLLCADCEVSSS